MPDTKCGQSAKGTFNIACPIQIKNTVVLFLMSHSWTTRREGEEVEIKALRTIQSAATSKEEYPLSGFKDMQLNS